MATVLDVLNFIETIAPSSMAESWDNVGLLCGRKHKEVTKILVALDPFRGVIQEAIAEQADLIVTHHPLIFDSALMAVNEDTETGRNLLTLIENGIAAINAHTNLDQAPGGVNACLAAKLGLENVSVIEPQGVDAQGREWGLLRQGTVEEQPLSHFLATVKEALHCQGLRYADAGKPVRRVAVGGGACGSEWQSAVHAGCDTFVTSDIKYNQFWDAQDAGLNLIDAGHFSTENPVTAYLAEKLTAAFPEIQVKISESHCDCMNFF